MGGVARSFAPSARGPAPSRRALPGVCVLRHPPTRTGRAGVRRALRVTALGPGARRPPARGAQVRGARSSTRCGRVAGLGAADVTGVFGAAAAAAVAAGGAAARGRSSAPGAARVGGWSAEGMRLPPLRPPAVPWAAAGHGGV